jgi:hypothetical protein
MASVRRFAGRTGIAPSLLNSSATTTKSGTSEPESLTTTGGRHGRLLCKESAAASSSDANSPSAALSWASANWRLVRRELILYRPME